MDVAWVRLLAEVIRHMCGHVMLREKVPTEMALCNRIALQSILRQQ